MMSANESQEKLQLEVKQMLIDILDLEDLSPDDIENDAPLFVEGLGLDSIDALEIGLALQKRYRIELKGESEETKKHFLSVDSLTKLIASYQE